MNIEHTIWLLAHSNDPEDKREWAVLYWKSKGLKHEEVGKVLNYGIKSVQRFMTSAYKRFEVPPILNKYEKLAYLEENVFPLMRKFIASEPDSVKALPPPINGEVYDPNEEFDQEDSDNTNEKGSKALIPQNSIIQIPPSHRENPWIPRLRRIFFAIVATLSISALAIYFYDLGKNQNAAPVIQAVTQVVTQILPTNIPTATNAPTSTSAPTSTNTFTPEPTFTDTPEPFVPPADGVLFQENFDNGISNELTTYQNDWITANGHLTISTVASFSNNFEWIEINHPEWKNYIVSVDVANRRNSQGGEIGAIAIAVRTESQSHYIGVLIDTLSNIYWAQIGSSQNDSIAISGQNRDIGGFDTGSNVEIIVKDNNYTFRLNGKKIQTISINGYDSGGIALGIECLDGISCPTLDNLKVIYLP